MEELVESNKLTNTNHFIYKEKKYIYKSILFVHSVRKYR